MYMLKLIFFIKWIFMAELFFMVFFECHSYIIWFSRLVEIPTSLYGCHVIIFFLLPVTSYLGACVLYLTLGDSSLLAHLVRGESLRF